MREPDQRTFGFLDHVALWASLGATFYLLPFGSLLVPQLSIPRAALAVVIAALIAAFLLAAVAAAAARSGSSTLGFLTTLFGDKASPALAVLLLFRNVVFGAFALSLIATSAELVSERALGAGLRPLWVVLFGAAGLWFLLRGPDFAVRKVLKRAGLVLLVLVAVGVTASAYMEFEIPSYLKRNAVGGWPTFWQAIDLMLIAPLLWLPVVADFSRFAKNASAAARGTFLGFFVAAAWFGIIGVIYLPAVESGDIAGFVVGMKLGLGALILLAVLQLDEVFANGYSASVALASVIPLGRRTIAVAAGVLLIAAAMPIDLFRIEGSLLILGSVFVPLFGVVLADQLLGLAAAPAHRPALALAAWLAGFALYQWIAPPDAAWWHDALDWLIDVRLGLPFPLTDEATWLGAAIPAFLLSFAIHLNFGWALGRAQRSAPTPATAPVPAPTTIAAAK